MSTDRELLELAAKAAGIKLADPVNSHIPSGGVWIVTERSNRDRVWDPLNNDGDALRLAVNLNLDIRYESYDAGVAAIVGGAWDGAPEAVREIFELDGLRAVRRAITRAAAEIERAMQ